MEAMQVAPSGGQIYNLCKWRHLVVKYVTNASGAMLLPNLVQVTESVAGSVAPLAMFEMKELCVGMIETVQFTRKKVLSLFSLKIN